ncbi:pyridoxal phosphate-dependent transferase [Mycena olivaceomarginata]|nr:pyridoxal phosphate-dependent transferase [Mycena olivaceomarginata]
MSNSTRVINLSAGPCALPESVLHEACQGLLNFNGTGVGIAEISHRAPEFIAYLTEVQDLIRTQLDVPQTHSILFAQGGGALQFSVVVQNLLARHRLLYPELPDSERVLDYVLTGRFSELAFDEAKRLGGGRVNTVVDARLHSATGKFDNIPSHAAYNFSPDPALVFYCENETVNGVQFSDGVDAADPTSFPFHLLPKDTPLVADYSSSFMSRPIPHLADHAVIFASAQKNIGPAGVTVLIVRNDCLPDVDAAAALGAQPVPHTLAYKTLADHGCLYNTPPVFAIYVTGLVLRRQRALGGPAHFAVVNRRKAAKLYAAVEEGARRGVLRPRVKEGRGRSVMNVVFDFYEREVEGRFVAGAAARGIKGIMGTRLSIYNAVTEEQVDAVVAYMWDFFGQLQVRSLM